MKRTSGQGFKERFRARREERKRRRIEAELPRHAPIDYGREQGGLKDSYGGAGGGGTGSVGAG